MRIQIRFQLAGDRKALCQHQQMSTFFEKGKGSAESLGTNPHSYRLGIGWGDFLFYIENGILCVLIRIASSRRF